MEPRVVWHGLDDVGGVRGQPGKLVDHHIRRGSCERSTYCLSVERIGDGRRSTAFTQQFDTRSATYHASNLVTQGAKGAHQRTAHRPDGASKIGEASGRARVRPDVSHRVVVVPLTKKRTKQ